MGFISNIFGPKGEARPETKPFVVKVPLASSIPITERTLRNGLEQLGSPTSISSCSGKDGTITCTIMDEGGTPGMELGSVACGLMPNPIPWPEMENVCQRSWRWPEAAQVLRPHTRHWLVCVTARSDSEYAAAITVRLTCALLNQPGVLGIYVDSAGLVHSPEFWRANLDSEENACAADLWVHFGMESYDDGTTSLRTQGLASFGVMEIEMIRSAKPYAEMYERARELAGYLIHEGPVLSDGHTVGRTVEEKITVRHEPSVYVLNERVHRIYV